MDISLKLFNLIRYFIKNDCYFTPRHEYYYNNYLYFMHFNDELSWYFRGDFFLLSFMQTISGHLIFEFIQCSPYVQVTIRA